MNKAFTSREWLAYTWPFVLEANLDTEHGYTSDQQLATRLARDLGIEPVIGVDGESRFPSIIWELIDQQHL